MSVTSPSLDNILDSDGEDASKALPTKDNAVKGGTKVLAKIVESGEGLFLEASVDRDYLCATSHQVVTPLRAGMKMRAC